MDKSNLFERIERYDGENFTTEILAYILEKDHGVKNAFLDLLLSRQPRNCRPRLRKDLRSCEIETQQFFGPERPDMTITSKTGAMVFVEIKTQAQEGDGQIKRYLKYGHVAYLTPRGHGEPDLDGADTSKYKYLGQFSWDEVCSVIEGHDPDNILHKEFLEYLEARHMGPLKPISEDDVRASLHAPDAIRKFQALVEAVRKGIEPDWVRELGKNVGGKKADWGLATGDLPYWWFRPRDWAKRGGGLYLSIGVYVEKGAQDGPCFYVGLWTERRKFGGKLEADGKLRTLCNDIGWTWDDDGVPQYWGYCKTFPAGTGRIDKIAQRQIKNVRSEEKKIRTLVKLVEKML